MKKIQRFVKDEMHNCYSYFCSSPKQSLFIFYFLFSLGIAQAEVFYAQDEALQLAFPDADEVQKKPFVLNAQQLELAQNQAKTKITGMLFTFYIGKKAGNIIGYAAIDSHIVRTQSETFLIVLNLDGKIEKVVLLAFNEPPEYMTSIEWNQQFIQKDHSDKLLPGQDIQGIAGSTLSVNAISEGVRKVLALYDILLKQK